MKFTFYLTKREFRDIEEHGVFMDECEPINRILRKMQKKFRRYKKSLK